MDNQTAENMIRSASIVLEELYAMCTTANTQTGDILRLRTSPDSRRRSDNLIEVAGDGRYPNDYAHRETSAGKIDSYAQYNNYTLGRMLDSLSRDVSRSNAQAKASINKCALLQYQVNSPESNGDRRASVTGNDEFAQNHTAKSRTITHAIEDGSEGSRYIPSEPTQHASPIADTIQNRGDKGYESSNKDLKRKKISPQFKFSTNKVSGRDDAKRGVVARSETDTVSPVLKFMIDKRHDRSVRETIPPHENNNKTGTSSNREKATSQTRPGDIAADARGVLSGDSKHAPIRPLIHPHGNNQSTQCGGNSKTSTLVHKSKATSKDTQKRQRMDGGSRHTKSKQLETDSKGKGERHKHAPTRPARRSGSEAEATQRHRRNLAYFMDDPLNPYAAWPLPPKRERPNMDTDSAGKRQPERSRSPQQPRDQTPQKAKPKWRSVGKNVEYTPGGSEKVDYKQGTRRTGNFKAKFDADSTGPKKTNAESIDTSTSTARQQGREGSTIVQPVKMNQSAKSSDRDSKGQIVRDANDRATSGKAETKPQTRRMRTLSESKAQAKGRTTRRSVEASDRPPRKRTRLSDQMERTTFQVKSTDGARKVKAKSEDTNITPMPKINSKKAPLTKQRGQHMRGATGMDKKLATGVISKTTKSKLV